MKKISVFFMTIITAVFLFSCNTKSSSSQTAQFVQKEITDISKIYKKNELPELDKINQINSFLYDEKSKKIYIIGTDSDGNIKCCKTDSTFSTYDTSDFNLKINNAEENFTSVFSSDKIFLVVTHVSHDTELTDETDYSEYMQNAEYSYFLYEYDTDCRLVSENEIALPDEYRYAAISEITNAKDDRFIIKTDLHFLISKNGRFINEINEDKLNEELKSNGDYLSYYQNSNAFYGIKSDGSEDKLIDFINSGFTNLRLVVPIGNDEFICCDGNKMYLLSERDETEYSDTKEITLAVTRKYDSIQNIIADFNAQSNHFRIKVKDYSEGYEYSSESLENVAKNMEMDIISGNFPDIVWLDSNEINKLSSKDVFADIYDYIDSDKTYSRDSFLQNYLKSAETNGHLYSIAPTFYILTIAAKSEYVKNENWNFDEFSEIYNSLPNGMELFDASNNRNAVMNFLTNFGENFIDRTKNDCSFDSDEFIKMLEFSSQFPSFEDYSPGQYSCRLDTALLSTFYINSFRDINAKKQCFFGNDDITFVGFPSDNKKGSLMLFSNQFAIMKNSPNKQGAWEFIRTFFDNNNYKMNADGIPVTETGLEIAMEEALEMPYYIDENQKKIYVTEEDFDYNSDLWVDITPMTKEEQKKYYDFVHSISKASSGNEDTASAKIISEEEEIFFDGRYTAKECAEMIQNRISIMLSEQS